MTIFKYYAVLTRSMTTFSINIMYLFSCSNIVLLPTKKLCQARILPTIANISLINQKVRPLFSIFWSGRVPLLCWSKYSYIKAMKRWPVRYNMSINVWVNIMYTPMHNVIHLALIEIRTHNISGDRHWLHW
jgi:hypothetical protein